MGTQDAHHFSGSVVHESHREPCQRRLVVPATEIAGLCERISLVD
jgi:hypothetical protein